ncbi:MAG TPA: TIGR04282 family arsenosugar biosynthesis glycosyltransferase [Candidatus Limnocylindria bacterium]|nr:TIGR04282 family arsenosugar biosynthesis glycosyltransferase [Candidatus Limnocylindria bacterium]
MKRIALFARRPEAGRVKTRLSPALPSELAHRLYRGMLLDAFGALRAVPDVQRLLYWADPPVAAGEDSDPAGFEVRAQRGADLGARLANAFAELLDPPGAHAIVIGADCPELGPRTLERALAALREHDLVLGPTIDGGYYLIGLRRPVPALFQDVHWGTEQVIAETRARAAATGTTWVELEPLADVDTPADLVNLVARALAAEDFPARHTSAALQVLGLLPDLA